MINHFLFDTELSKYEKSGYSTPISFLFRLENNRKLSIKNHCMLKQVVKHVNKLVHHRFLNTNSVIYEKSNVYIFRLSRFYPILLAHQSLCGELHIVNDFLRKYVEKDFYNLDLIIFLKVEKRDPSLLQDYGRDPQYADASIDAMREQKLAVNEFIIKNHLLLFFLFRNYNVI